MQVANALNNHIRILFNPKVEAFKLFDFLIVKSENDRYLAQITEIYEDKFDASQNVAKLKLFYKVNEENEVMPYDNFTPNKECEIVKVKQEEIENFINEDKETFPFATNAKDLTTLEMQYEFFDNNPIILADKIENANIISLNLAKNLSNKKHAVIIDATGILEFEGAKKIKAAKTFKMPLDYTTIDFVFEKCLNNATIEFQAIGTEIINEIKKFARAQEGGFIPFNAFVKVLLEQYKATPYQELRLLLGRVKKLQMDEIFARSKKDKEVLSKTIQKNKITILDLSSVDSFWQRAYFEYIISAIEEEIYLISRINEETFNPELINKIYFEKRNISFVPNVSYNYKKLPSVVQNCKNYILMPSLYQRNDFLDANFALSNLIADGCIIFGENTDNFLYLAKDLEAKIEEKKINYRRIALSQSKIDDEEKKIVNEAPVGGSSPANARLDDFEAQMKKSHPSDEFEPLVDKNTPESQAEPEKDEFQKLVDIAQEDSSEPEPVEELEEIEEIEEIKEEPQEELQEIEEIQEVEEVDELEKLSQLEDASNEEEIEEIEKVEQAASFENILLTEEHLDILEEPQVKEEKPKTKSLLDTELLEFGQDVPETFNPPTEPPKPRKSKATQEILLEEFAKSDIPEHSKIKGLDELSEPEEETKPEPKAEQVQEEEPQQEQLSDEELDFFEIAKESSLKHENKNVVIDDIEYRTESDDSIEEETSEAEEKAEEPKKEEEPEVEPEVEEVQEEVEEENEEQAEDLDLLKMANQSYDNNFDDIINNKTPKTQTQIEEQNADEPAEKESLPIYTEEQPSDGASFKTGDNIEHAKYGKGVVIKIVQYEQRQLLQIEFENSGKKLLDPKVADIKPL